MSDPIPSQAPPGFKWTKSFLGLFGPWVLVEDPENPLPPVGYRYHHDFWTGRKELISVIGEGVNFLDPKDDVSRPKPAPLAISPIYVMPQPIPPEKIGKVALSVEGLASDDSTSRPLPGSDKYDVRKRDQGIFG